MNLLSPILTHWILPMGTVLLGLGGGFAADRSAALRRQGGDRGDYWTRICRRSCLVLGLPVLVCTVLLPLLPEAFERSGWHLQADLTGFAGGAPGWAYLVMLLLPWGAWSALLAWGLAERPGGREVGSALAGAPGIRGSRAWVLLCALPLVAMLAFALPRLGGGPGAYPAATWSTLAALAVSLVGVAVSAGHSGSVGSAAGLENSAWGGAADIPLQTLPPWPRMLSEQGIESSPVAVWKASPPAREVRGDATALAERLLALGAREIAPELTEAAARLIHPAAVADPGKAESPGALVFAPDGCGQEEVVAATAATLAQRFHETTLVVTSGSVVDLTRRLRAWTAEPRRFTAVAAGGELDRTAWIWVTDAETLSHHLLSAFKDRSLLRSLGLVVWWGLESWTGVLGANVWAVSRRLHRLLRQRGRGGVKTLALVRSAAHGDAQLESFVRRLLPHSFPKDSQTHVHARFPRQVHVHRLTSHAEHFRRGRGSDLPQRSRHLPLVATRASVEAAWPTGLRLPEVAAEPEIQAALQLPAREGVLGDSLLLRRADAAVWVETLGDDEILSLAEIVAQGGRAASAGLPHHAAVVLSDNPYAEHLVESLSRHAREGFGVSRRLLCPAGHPSLLERHLLLALDELPDTRAGLLRDFLWEEEHIRRILDRIDFEGQLHREEVRYLDSAGELRRDSFYRSSRPLDRERHPLDTVGARLVDVRAPEEAQDDDGVRLRLDPERLTVVAYPLRIFMAGGRRYRVREWSSVEEVVRRGWLACRQEAACSRTWRVRHSYLDELRPVSPPAGLGRQGRLLTRRLVDLVYEEEVTAVVEVTRDLTTGEEETHTHRLTRPVAVRFSTRALALRLPGAEEAGAVHSFAQVLRHLLPVHLGVEDGALEVVPLEGEDIGGVETHGVALVDLYPGGIGLLDAVSDDVALLLELLERGRDWLRTCPCGSEEGCPRCVRSIAAQAADPGLSPYRSAALELLERLLP